MIATEPVRILIVDDHEVVRRGVKQILEEAFPYVEIGEADTGQKGLTAVRQEPWDLAIVDVSLPDQSVLELLCELHSTAPRLPLMVLSLHSGNVPFVCFGQGLWPISPKTPRQKSWPGRSSRY